MNIYVIGLGSMGKRRIGLLKEFGVKIFGVDTNESRCREAEDKLGIETINVIDSKKIEKDDCVFVCTAPISHGTIINDCLKKGLHVFTEINLISDNYDENIKLAKEKGLVLFLSSTFLYRPETKYIIERVKRTESKCNYIYHIGQYLPDWHPWENFNNFFVGNKRTNGCREIFAIELPWIVSCFGEINEVQSSKRKISNLDLDYNDSYFVNLKHKSGAEGVLIVDVVSRKAVRKLEVIGEDVYLSWSGTPDSVNDYDIVNKQDILVSFDNSEHKEGYASFITENPYREEIKAFFACINNPEIERKWDFERDMKVLDIIDNIEK